MHVCIDTMACRCPPLTVAFGGDRRVRGSVWGDRLRAPTFRCLGLRPDVALLSEEVIIGGVRYPREHPDGGFGTTRFGRQAANGVYALYAGNTAERTLRADRFRDEQQPWYGVGPWCVGTLLLFTRDLAAIGGFPLRAGIVSANLLSARIKEIGLGSDEYPFIGAGLIFCRSALVDLDPFCGNDHRERFVQARLELIRHGDSVCGARRTRARRKGERQRRRDEFAIHTALLSVRALL